MSFQEAQKKLKEHYRLEVPLSSIQSIVENHAKNVFEFIENDKQKLKGGNAKQLIAEMDGSMFQSLIQLFQKRVDKTSGVVGSLDGRKLVYALSGMQIM